MNFNFHLPTRIQNLGQLLSGAPSGRPHRRFIRTLFPNRRTFFLMGYVVQARHSKISKVLPMGPNKRGHLHHRDYPEGRLQNSTNTSKMAMNQTTESNEDGADYQELMKSPVASSDNTLALAAIG